MEDVFFFNFKGPPVSSHKAAIVPILSELSHIICHALLAVLMSSSVVRFEVTMLTVDDFSFLTL